MLFKVILAYASVDKNESYLLSNTFLLYWLICCTIKRYGRKSEVWPFKWKIRDGIFLWRSFFLLTEILQSAEISCEKCNLNMWISLSLGHAVNQKTEKTSVYIRCFSFECAFSHCQLYLKLPFRIKAFKTALQPKETRLNWKGNTTFISQLFMLMLYPSAQLNMNSSRYNTFRSINNFWARESKARRPGKKLKFSISNKRSLYDVTTEMGFERNPVFQYRFINEFFVAWFSCFESSRKL